MRSAATIRLLRRRAAKQIYAQAGAPQPLGFSAEDFKTITSFISTLLGDVPADALSEVGAWVDLWCYSAQGVREAARNLEPLHRALAAAYFGETSVAESRPPTQLRLSAKASQT